MGYSPDAGRLLCPMHLCTDASDLHLGCCTARAFEWHSWAMLHRHNACWRSHVPGPPEPHARATVIERFRPRRRSLPTCASISLEYRQHGAKRDDVAMAVEQGRVQARSAAPVEKQGVEAIQPVTE